MVDRFYTRPELAHSLAKEVAARWPGSDVLFVEPSAGAGAFVAPLRNISRKVRAMDIEPAKGGIRRGNFLAMHDLFAGEHSAVVVMGNPPFGKNASLAVRFFNRAADHADEIAFIVPRTFRKASVQKRLHRHFHLVCDRDVADDAFLKDGSIHDVPCAWQIWARRDYPRPEAETPCIDHLVQFLKAPARADFAMRRVGFYAGRVETERLSSLSKTTHYFMREKAEGVIDILRAIDWTKTAAQTAGVRSLSKTEIARMLAEEYHAQV